MIALERVTVEEEMDTPTSVTKFTATNYTDGN